jgi:hypothetical protein
MRSRIIRTVGLATAALLVAVSVQAQGKGNGKAKHRIATVQREDVYRRGVSEREDGIYRRDDRDRDRDGIYRDRDGVYRDIYGNVIYRDDDRYRDNRRIPPGLAKKPGGMPPGQFKKLYRRYSTNEGAGVLGEIMRRRGYYVSRIVPYGDSHYVYYRGYNGPEQRAIVYPGADRLGFNNVPAAILQLVLGQLY